MKSKGFTLIELMIVVAIIAGLSGSIMGKIIVLLVRRTARFTRSSQQLYFVLGCALLVAPCSCKFKNQSPGFDLLMSTDWEAIFAPKK